MTHSTSNRDPGRLVTLSGIRHAIEANHTWQRRHAVPENPATPLPNLPVVAFSSADFLPGKGYVLGGPNPEIRLSVAIGTARHAVIGDVGISVSPLLDCTYIWQIEIDAAYRGRGYGLATLKLIIDTIGLAVMPVQDINSKFWSGARKYSYARFPILEQVSASAFHLESVRWSHLHPATDAYLCQLAREQQHDRLKAQGVDPACHFCDHVYRTPNSLGRALTPE